jgi:hypothetical protein
MGRRAHNVCQSWRDYWRGSKPDVSRAVSENTPPAFFVMGTADRELRLADASAQRERRRDRRGVAFLDDRMQALAGQAGERA